MLRTLGAWKERYMERHIYEKYTQSALSWSMVSIGTGAANYKQFVQVCLISDNGKMIISHFSFGVNEKLLTQHISGIVTKYI